MPMCNWLVSVCFDSIFWMMRSLKASTAVPLRIAAWISFWSSHLA